MRYLLYCIVTFVSCSSVSDIYTIPDKSAYETAHRIWQNSRIKSLTASEGWLSLEGLHWLKEGQNTMGSREGLDIAFSDHAAAFVGNLLLRNDSLYFMAGPECYITSDDKRFIEGYIQSDREGEATRLVHKSYVFYVIERGDRYALRIKNTLARTRYQLKEIPSYPVNYDLIFKAEVELPQNEELMVVKDVTGYNQSFSVVARLVFRLDGKSYRLSAFDGGADYYFVIFTDQTTSNETYGGGRYLYVEKPVGRDSVTIDFNRSVNPPCAFTDFATCPLPPADNDLPIVVNAGERYPVH